MTENIRLAFLANPRSVHTKRWLEYFVGKGFDVHLMTFTSRPIKGVKIHGLRFFGKFAYPLRISEIRKAIKKIDPDILHAHYISNYGVYAAFTGFHPLILSAWGSDISVDPEKSRIHGFFITFALKRADLVRVGDETGKRRLIELGCDERKIFVQAPGVDTKQFSPKARSQSLRRELGIDNKYSVILARLWEPRYRVDVFIKAIPTVLRKIPNVKFILAGSGHLEQSLKRLAKRLGIYNSIVFVGRILHRKMPAFLASADIYVDTLADLREGATAKWGGSIGATTIEAMACGTPQVLPDRLCVRLGDWFKGLMYKELDSQDMAEKIVYLLREEKIRKEIGVKSREMALKIGDWKKIARRWENIYKHLKTTS